MAHQFFFNPYILDNLPLPEKGFDVVQDMAEPLLRLYVTSRGAKTFFIRKRVHGNDKRIIIGNYPDIDIDTARELVAKTLSEATKKIPKRRKKITFKQFLDIYLKNRVRRAEDSYVKLQRAIDKHLVNLFEKNISEITIDELQIVISNITGKAIAARMQEVLQSIFKYAKEIGYIKNNPAENLVKIEQKRRKRPLDMYSLHRLVDVVKELESPVMRTAFLMLVYSFLPKNKVFSMQWDDLDFNHYLWKNWPLSDTAVVLLQDLPQDSNWVFVGRCKNHLMDPRCAWKRVAESAGVPDLTMDDVYKFLKRRLVWASDREDVRNNMNMLLQELDL